MLPKPEVGIQFGAGGASSAAELEAEGIPTRPARFARRSGTWRRERTS